MGPRPANTSVTITLTPHIQCHQHMVRPTRQLSHHGFIFFQEIQNFLPPKRRHFLKNHKSAGKMPDSLVVRIYTIVPQVNLTLRSVSVGEGGLTKMIPCISFSMREATTTRSINSNYVGTESSLQCLSCLESWLYWLQPQHWIGSVDQSQSELYLFTLYRFLLLVYSESHHQQSLRPRLHRSGGGPGQDHQTSRHQHSLLPQTI